MTEWAPKRFWKTATTEAVEGGHAVALDGRAVRTPAKARLIVPTAALAAAIAAEWDAQDERIDPGTMPFTRMANSAIDKVRPQFADVAEMVAAYGDADLLCYRADAPEELVTRQAQAWDPLLDWAADQLGARLTPRTGIMHSAQDAQALAALSARVHGLGPFQLVAFHDLVALTGSLVIGFALAESHLSVARAWQVSRIDEQWQIEQWGEDEEAQEIAARKFADLQHAHRFFALLNGL